MNSLLLISELVDRIIDFLHADRNALRSCALVARLWVSTAQLHYFRSITVKLHTDECLGLIEALQTKPHLGANIRRLTISHRTKFHKHAYERFTALMRAIPRLLSLILENVEWLETAHSSQEALIRSTPLRSLTISHISPHTRRTFVRFARAFPPLTRLQILDVNIPAYDLWGSAHEDPFQRTPRLAAHELFVACGEAEVSHDALRWALDEHSPQKLTCALTWYAGLNTVYLLCYTFAAHIRNLHIHVALPVNDSDMISYLGDIHYRRVAMTGLEEVVVTLTDNTSGLYGYMQGNLVFALSILPGMFTGAPIRTFQLDLRAVTKEDAPRVSADRYTFEYFEWERVRKTALRGLKAPLVIRLRNEHKTYMWMEAVMDGLADLEREGIAQYSYE